MRAYITRRSPDRVRAKRHKAIRDLGSVTVPRILLSYHLDAAPTERFLFEQISPTIYQLPAAHARGL